MFCLFVTGCATMDQQVTAEALTDLAGSPEIVEPETAYPILDRVQRHAIETEEWIATGSNRPIDPFKVAKAHMCPDFLLVAIPEFKRIIVQIKNKATLVKGKLSSLGSGDTNILLDLTKRRYATPDPTQDLDPEDDLKRLKNDVLEIGTGVIDACKPILPMKEFNWLVEKVAGIGIK
jgi:hypothetical protein